MILEHFIRNYFPNPAKALDLCAAPGGKSTHLSALLPAESLLVANEVIHSRAGILSENLIKWGNPNTLVISNDPLEIGKLLPDFFDAIVADLPCSGEGMFRKDPVAVAGWSIDNVRLCAKRQRRIVADIWPALKPGGILVYSTCTYNREENEENLDWICREFDAELLEEPRRLMPHQIKGEGFFIAGIRKKENTFSGCSSKGKSKKYELKKEKGSLFQDSPFACYLAFPAGFTYVSDHYCWIAVPNIHFPDYLQIKTNLRILSAGIALGEIKGHDLIPAHALAMSNDLSDAAFPCWEVDKETALIYLRKEAFPVIPTGFPKGYILITYKRLSLGFVKNIGMRVNNLYPQGWRIRMKRIIN
jgi:NOL1/NOP2/fmu family ribosome biogenesis protein